MDLEDWRKLNISEEFAKNQQRVVEAFGKMGVLESIYLSLLEHLK